MSNASASEKIEQLIREYFPWGTVGYPDMPEDQDLKSMTFRVKSWIDSKVGPVAENVALALHARIQAVIDEVQAGLHQDEKTRLFYRSDLYHLRKSAESILDKMVRNWDPSEKRGPKLSFGNFDQKMRDLARFRIILNFLSDVEEVSEKLQQPYISKREDLSKLTAAQQALFDDFVLDDNSLRDLIKQKPAERENGERCFKGVFALRKNEHFKAEVQIQTMLQEAWDKKDHFLIYEPRRRGEKIEDSHSIEIFAMSELLYVADLTFNRLLDGIRARRKKEGE